VTASVLVSPGSCESWALSMNAKFDGTRVPVEEPSTASRKDVPEAPIRPRPAHPGRTYIDDVLAGRALGFEPNFAMAHV
jgi:hypothetical protein